MSLLSRSVSGATALGFVAAAVAATSGSGLQTQITAGATAFLIACWGLRLLSEGTAALFFFLVLAAGNAVPTGVIFSGFTSPAFWLVFSGLILGKAIRDSGLSRRLSELFRAAGGGSYPVLLAYIVAGSVLFAFFIPSSMGRVVILVPLLMELAADYGFTAKDKGYTGIILAGVLGTYLPPFGILPANLPNVIFAGASKSLYSIDIGYVQYLLLHFPVLGILKSVCIWGYLRFAFPDTIAAKHIVREKTPWSAKEKGAVAVLSAALALWMLDSWHGVSPGWVSLGAAVVLLLPAPGWFGKNLLTGLRMDTLLFVACAIGLGNILQASQLGDFTVGHLLQLLPLAPAGGLANAPAVLALFMSTGLLTSLPGIPSLFVPLAGQLAQAAHLPLFSLLMLLVPAFSTVLLPYQAPPLIVAVHTGRLQYKAMFLACLALSLVTILVLFPLDLLWWRLLGTAFTLQ